MLTPGNELLCHGIEPVDVLEFDGLKVGGQLFPSVADQASVLAARLQKLFP